MQGTKSPPVLTGGTGEGEGEGERGGNGMGGDTKESKKKKERDKRQDFCFKYIKMDTVGLYIHIHLTKPGRKGRGGLFKVSDI